MMVIYHCTVGDALIPELVFVDALGAVSAPQRPFLPEKSDGTLRSLFPRSSDDIIDMIYYCP